MTAALEFRDVDILFPRERGRKGEKLSAIEEQKRAQNPGYRWRGPVDRSAKVTIEFAEPQRVTDQDRYRSGLPIVVIFPQRSTNSLLASLRQRLALTH